MAASVKGTEVKVLKESIEGIEFDIKEYYNKFISTIDQYRSFNNPLIAINVDTVNSVDGFSTTEPVESRCHAFYRLVGFPVVSPDGNYFSPGVGMTVDQIETAVNISNKFLNSGDLPKILEQQRNYQSNIRTLYQRQDIGASVFSLSYKNINNFNSFVKNLETNPFQLKINSQNYTPIYKDVNGADMLSYFYNNKSKTAASELGQFKDAVPHIIKPFMVDPRIAFSAGEKSFRVPFYSGEDVLQNQPPFIETVCVDRFSNEQNKLSEKEINEINTIVGSGEKIQNIIFLNFVRKINFLMQKLNANIKIINDTQTKYHFYPEASKSGPLNGFRLKKISAIDNAKNGGHNKKFEVSIVDLTAKISFKNINLNLDRITSLLSTQNSPKTNLPSLSVPVDAPNLVVKTATDSNVKSLEDQLNELVTTRRKECLEACDAIQNIEYITGYYTGFGIIDYLVLVNALYLIETSSLLGLLDDTARYNLNTNPKYSKLVSNPTYRNIEASLSDYAEKVKTLYDTVQSIFEKLTSSKK